MGQDLKKLMLLRPGEVRRAVGPAVPHSRVSQQISDNAREQEESLELYQSSKPKLGCYFSSTPAQTSRMAHLNTEPNGKEFGSPLGVLVSVELI